MAEWTLLEAVNQAFAAEMARDDDVGVLGEDVGVNGGVFRATAGLLDEYGPGRVIDTPLAESVIVGMAIGMAAQGLGGAVEKAVQQRCGDHGRLDIIGLLGILEHLGPRANRRHANVNVELAGLFVGEGAADFESGAWTDLASGRFSDPLVLALL